RGSDLQTGEQRAQRRGEARLDETADPMCPHDPREAEQVRGDVGKPVQDGHGRRDEHAAPDEHEVEERAAAGHEHEGRGAGRGGGGRAGPSAPRSRSGPMTREELARTRPTWATPSSTPPPSRHRTSPARMSTRPPIAKPNGTTRGGEPPRRRCPPRTGPDHPL